MTRPTRLLPLVLLAGALAACSASTTPGTGTPDAGTSDPLVDAGDDAPDAGDDAPDAGDDAPDAGEDAPDAGGDTTDELRVRFAFGMTFTEHRDLNVTLDGAALAPGLDDALDGTGVYFVQGRDEPGLDLEPGEHTLTWTGRLEYEECLDPTCFEMVTKEHEYEGSYAFTVALGTDYFLAVLLSASTGGPTPVVESHVSLSEQQLPAEATAARYLLAVAAPPTDGTTYNLVVGSGEGASSASVAPTQSALVPVPGEGEQPIDIELSRPGPFPPYTTPFTLPALADGEVLPLVLSPGGFIVPGATGGLGASLPYRP